MESTSLATALWPEEVDLIVEDGNVDGWDRQRLGAAGGEDRAIKPGADSGQRQWFVSGEGAEVGDALVAGGGCDQLVQTRTVELVEKLGPLEAAAMFVWIVPAALVRSRPRWRAALVIARAAPSPPARTAAM